MLSKISIILIQIYQQYFRVLFPISCRFYPSCSEYAKQAIIKYGFVLGVFKAIQRLMRCQPFSKRFGYDPLL
ncbi:MAG: membrane protein insertion efficiency factor YidD [Candidatus Omnitrophica bacterium]|nr:membrane protein insertion efficiency factor YidD [Candidatus Omnitrophota bacterium]